MYNRGEDAVHYGKKKSEEKISGAQGGERVRVRVRVSCGVAEQEEERGVIVETSTKMYSEMKV